MLCNDVPILYMYLYVLTLTLSEMNTNRPSSHSGGKYDIYY